LAAPPPKGNCSFYEKAGGNRFKMQIQCEIHRILEFLRSANRALAEAAWAA